MTNYDSAERLVETIAPHDASDFYAFNFMRRYLYDPTAGGTVSIGSNTGLHALGRRTSSLQIRWCAGETGRE